MRRGYPIRRVTTPSDSFERFVGSGQLLALRATLLQEHVWRQREGL
jgi:hypothetical protein